MKDPPQHGSSRETREHKMRQLEINSFVSFTLAIILLFVGKIALNRSEICANTASLNR